MGIDLNAARGNAGIAVLNRSQRLLSQELVKLEELEALVQSTSPEVIALTSPISLNTGRMSDPTFRMTLDPMPPGSRYQSLRLSEYELISRGLPVSRTPSSFDACGTGVQRSLRTTSALAVLGYLPDDGNPREKMLVEVPGDAWFQELLGCKPFTASSLEGRIQRQLALQGLNLNVPDAMEFFEEVTRHKLLRGLLPEKIVLPLSVLNAAAAAYTAWALKNSPSRIDRSGCSDEGYLYLVKPASSH